MKILANDGLNATGVDLLTKNGFEVIMEKIGQTELSKYINDNNIDILLVRSATKVRKDLIDACPRLKLVGRGGVGLDNIDVEYAKSKGVKVFNTPAASSASVAELVFAHLLSGARFLAESNREMPKKGHSEFASLKKAYKAGGELRGKTIGIVGLGRIGREVARLAYGWGMNVLAADSFVSSAKIKMEFTTGQSFEIEIKTIPLDEVFQKSDFITFHVPAQKNYLVGKEEIAKMKDGVALVNCARGGVFNENELVEALNSGKVSFAGLDVYENEPTPSETVLKHPRISLTPHIGAATKEAQKRIGISLAEQIMDLSKTL